MRPLLVSCLRWVPHPALSLLSYRPPSPCAPTGGGFIMTVTCEACSPSLMSPCLTVTLLPPPTTRAGSVILNRLCHPEPLLALPRGGAVSPLCPGCPLSPGAWVAPPHPQDLPTTHSPQRLVHPACHRLWDPLLPLCHGLREGGKGATGFRAQLLALDHAGTITCAQTMVKDLRVFPASQTVSKYT